MSTGLGLLAVAVAIVIATAVFHMEVKRVYYPQVKWQRSQREDKLFHGENTEVEQMLDQGVPLHEIADELDARDARY